MILNHLRDKATPGYEKDSRCPDCESPLVAKCGQIVTWHWAHKVSADCSAGLGETEWHMEWKSHFPLEWIERKYGDRRADVLLPSNEVIEFQRKGLDADTIQAREFAAHGRISWVFNGTEFGERLELRNGKNKGEYSRYRSFRWKQPTKSWLAIRGRFSIDIGSDNLFHVRKIGRSVPLGGYGNLDSKHDWIGLILKYKCLPNGHYPIQFFQNEYDGPAWDAHWVATP